MALTEGQIVRLKQPAISGPILDTRYNKDARQLEHLVDYVDEAGERHSRWFLDSQLESNE